MFVLQMESVPYRIKKVELARKKIGLKFDDLLLMTYEKLSPEEKSLVAKGMFLQQVSFNAMEDNKTVGEWLIHKDFKKDQAIPKNTKEQNAFVWDNLKPKEIREIRELLNSAEDLSEDVKTYWLKLLRIIENRRN